MNTKTDALGELINIATLARTEAAVMERRIQELESALRRVQIAVEASQHPDAKRDALLEVALDTIADALA